MGGIKNKQSNKTLFKLGSRLPSFSQPSEMLTRNTPNTRKPNRWSLYASRTIGSLRLVTLTKYLSIACLSLVLISTIGLNLYRTYSSSNIESNAEPVTSDTSTLASVAPTSISISISSYPATGDSDNGNLSLSIPQGGGLVAGRHTVSVNAGNEIDSYSVFLNGGTNESGVDNTDLVNTMADSLPSTGSLATSIPSLPWDTVDNFTSPTTFPMYGNGWGVALPDSYTDTYHDKERYETLIATPATIVGGAANYLFSGIPPLSYGQQNSNPDRLAGNEIISQTDSSSSSTDIYYGVKVDNPSTMLAGDYTANVVYTVIAELKVPSITGISPNPIDTGTSNKITLTGSNLDIVSKVTIDDRNTYRECTSLTHSGSTKLTCTLPAISNAGGYIITAETAGGQTATTTIQVKLPAPTITSVSPNEININNSTTTLTITGTDLATTSSVYIDFIDNDKVDSGEACTIKTKDNGQVTCTAPSRSSAGGPYTVRLTTDGGSASKANAVSYVSPAPTVTSVSPNTVSPHDIGKTLTFTIIGRSLSNIVQIQLTDRYNETTYCYPNVLTSSVMECRIQWVYQYPGDINATYYDSSGTAVFSDKFCTVKF